MIFVGVDPGSKRTGIAAVNQEGGVRYVQCISATSTEQMIENLAHRLRISGGDYCFAVEDQEYRHERAKGSPATIFPFAQAAGAAAAILAERSSSPVVLVKPMVWKGSVPKLQHHRRLCHKLSWEWEERGGKEPYVVPTVPDWRVQGADDITATQWPEVLDAIGIALYLRDHYEHDRI